MEHSFQQVNAPLFEGLLRYAERVRTKQMVQFHMPGHRGGRGVDSLFRRYGRALLGLDLTELREINYGHDPDFLLAAAEKLAAEAFGAKATFFLVNGASIGIGASLLTLGSRGAEVLVGRNCHLSVVHGLILSGMKPRFIAPRWLEGLPVLPPAEAVEQAMGETPKAEGIFLTNPGYSGIYGPVDRVAAVAKRYKLPLLIDEAHGGHLRYLGGQEAAQAGADLWVWGAHKILGSLTQTGLLHVGGELIDSRRVGEALQLLASTSPSYLLLASLDVARRRLFFHGERMFKRAAWLGDKVRRELQGTPGLRMIDPRELPAGYGLDPTKVVLSFRPSGISGLRAEEILGEKFGIQPEYADSDYLYFFISYAQAEAEVDQLIAACRRLAGSGERTDQGPTGQWGGGFVPPPWNNRSPVLTPREAFLAPAAHIRIDEAVGRVASGVVAAYPPGIPLWIPGEGITSELVEWALDLQRAGGYLKGIDAGTIKVVAD